MSSVATRRIARVLARTEVSVAGFLRDKDVWHEARPFVLAVAERLAFGSAAGAERVFLSCFKRDFDRRFAGDDGLVRQRKTPFQVRAQIEFE